MRRRGRDGHGSEDSSEGTEDRNRNLKWRRRGLTFALPGRYATAVREACGAFHVAGPNSPSALPRVRTDAPRDHLRRHRASGSSAVPGRGEVSVGAYRRRVPRTHQPTLSSFGEVTTR